MAFIYIFIINNLKLSLSNRIAHILRLLVSIILISANIYQSATKLRMRRMGYYCKWCQGAVNTLFLQSVPLTPQTLLVIMYCHYIFNWVCVGLINKPLNELNECVISKSLLVKRGALLKNRNKYIELRVSEMDNVNTRYYHKWCHEALILTAANLVSHNKENTIGCSEYGSLGQYIQEPRMARHAYWNEVVRSCRTHILPLLSVCWLCHSRNGHSRKLQILVYG